MPKNKHRSWITMALVGAGMTIAGLLSFLNGSNRPQRRQQEPMNKDVMFEARDVDASIIGWIGVGVIVSAFLIHGGVAVLYAYLSRAEFPRASQPVTFVKEGPKQSNLPRLQEDPHQDLERLREADRQTLSSYGWVDREKGTVRVPIDEAMRRVLEKGLPAAEKASPSPAIAATPAK
jgi:hypothetical protein